MIKIYNRVPYIHHIFLQYIKVQLILIYYFTPCSASFTHSGSKSSLRFQWQRFRNETKRTALLKQQKMVSGKSVKKAIKMTVKDQKLNFNSSVIRGSNVQQYSLKCWHHKLFHPLRGIPCWRKFYFHIKSRKACIMLTLKKDRKQSLPAPGFQLLFLSAWDAIGQNMSNRIFGHRLYINWTPTEMGLTKYLQNLIPFKNQQVSQIVMHQAFQKIMK